MPRAVQRATAADLPYSMSSGCATTHSTRWKDSSGRAGNFLSAILPLGAAVHRLRRADEPQPNGTASRAASPVRVNSGARRQAQRNELIDADRPPIKTA